MQVERQPCLGGDAEQHLVGRGRVRLQVRAAADHVDTHGDRVRGASPAALAPEAPTTGHPLRDGTRPGAQASAAALTGAGVRQGRPSGDRDAQLPGVAGGVLGGPMNRRDRRQPQRLVDHTGARVRPVRLRSCGPDLRRRAVRPRPRRRARAARRPARGGRPPRRRPRRRSRHLDVDHGGRGSGIAPGGHRSRRTTNATILYTYGATGSPKGAVGSHRNHLTNVMNTLLSGAVAGMLAASRRRRARRRPRRRR